MKNEGEFDAEKMLHSFVEKASKKYGEGMKRLVYIISTFLILTGIYGESVGAKDHTTDSVQPYRSKPRQGLQRMQNL
ncbi:MAG: hypothetical protein QF876_00475 [Desulfobacterales bacterium]|jgi:hypothetical protein|nr:hypothetical protein [Desulfobacterales bacterium]MDP6808736.1 hypothetical protein [Desulfobacterales bacterium]|tara:strand:+ start:14788 stop:15018 length:231 start_codon:yes stop_codon:yes gene_type:complete